MVSVNNSTSGAEAHLPFGGNGKSGNGSRQSGIWVLDQFTRWQSMNWDYAGKLQKAQMDVVGIEAAGPGWRSGEGVLRRLGVGGGRGAGHCLAGPYRPAGQDGGIGRSRTTLTRSCVRVCRPMDALTINEAAETTGWSPRMLRYVERVGLVEPRRSESGYRLYGPAELQRLRTLRELLAEHDIGLSDIAFALRLRTTTRCATATEAWLEARPERPEHVPVRRLAALGAGQAPAAADHPERPHGGCMNRHPHHRRLQGRRPLARRPSAARRSSSPSTRCPA